MKKSLDEKILANSPAWQTPRKTFPQVKPRKKVHVRTKQFCDESGIQWPGLQERGQHCQWQHDITECDQFNKRIALRFEWAAVGSNPSVWCRYIRSSSQAVKGQRIKGWECIEKDQRPNWGPERKSKPKSNRHPDI